MRTDAGRPLYVLGLTGPSGAGKSLVASLLEQDGFAVVDADRVARRVMAPGSPCARELYEAFGDAVRAPDGGLDRRALAALAFGSGENLRRLNAISHPHIVAEIERTLRELEQTGCRRAVLDAPALYESGADRLCDRVAAVVASPGVRLGRIVRRDGITREQALARISAQPPREYYTDRADTVLDSDAGTAALTEQAQRLARETPG